MNRTTNTQITIPGTFHNENHEVADTYRKPVTTDTLVGMHVDLTFHIDSRGCGIGRIPEPHLPCILLVENVLMDEIARNNANIAINEFNSTARWVQDLLKSAQGKSKGLNRKQRRMKSKKKK